MGKLEKIHQTATSIAGRCLPERRWFYMGPAFCVVLFTFTHYTFGYKKILDNVLYADVTCFASIICVGILSLLIRFIWFKRLEIPLIIFSCLSVFIGFFCMMNFENLPSELTIPLAIMSAVSLGIYDVVVPVLWFKFYASKNIETTSFSLFASFVIGCILSWFLIGLVPNRLFWGVFLIIACSGGSLVMAITSMSPTSAPSKEKDLLRPTSIIPLLVIAFLFSFALMMSVSFVGLESWHTETGWSILWPAAFIFGIIAFFAKRIDFGTLLYIALTLVVAGVLFASFLHINSSFIFTLATMGFAVHISYMVILFCSLSKRITLRAEHMACLLILATFGGCLLGRPIAFFISGFEGAEPLKTFVAICLIIAIIVCTFVCANNKTAQLYTKHRFQQSPQNTSSSPLSNPLIDAYALKQGLGEREREALALLLEGKTASQVADEMFIARGTAKAHIRHIYKKLDIHDREELFHLIKTIDRQY